MLRFLIGGLQGRAFGTLTLSFHCYVNVPKARPYNYSNLQI